MVHRPTDPRSPIQPGGRFPVKPLLLAMVAAASLWTWQQSRDRNGLPEPQERTAAPVPPPPSEPPTAPLRSETSARASANLATLFSSDDYPPAAMRNDEQGTVGYRLTIDRRGRVAACDVTSSSGSATLDRATCGILQRRARFEPARDAREQAVDDRYTGRVRWVLPVE